MEESSTGSWRASKQHAEKQELESTREPRCWGANVLIINLWNLFCITPSVFSVVKKQKLVKLVWQR